MLKSCTVQVNWIKGTERAGYMKTPRNVPVAAQPSAAPMDEFVCETRRGRRYDAEGRGLAGDVAATTSTSVPNGDSLPVREFQRGGRIC